MAALKLQQVPANVTVKVTHSGKPIAGIGVEIVPQAEADETPDPVFRAVTDETLDSTRAKGFECNACYRQLSSKIVGSRQPRKFLIQPQPHIRIS